MHNTMGRFSFRQCVALAVVVAMLFNVAVPFGVCRCEGCHCPSKSGHGNVSRFLHHCTTDNKCRCIPPEPSPDDECCGLAKMPCPCRCCDVQNSNEATHKAVLPLKRLDITPPWETVSVASVGFVNVKEIPSHVDNRRALLPLHVPLHVLLCVFLN